jgi:hypothetical protein
MLIVDVQKSEAWAACRRSHLVSSRRAAWTSEQFTGIYKHSWAERTSRVVCGHFYHLAGRMRGCSFLPPWQPSTYSQVAGSAFIRVAICAPELVAPQSSPSELASGDDTKIVQSKWATPHDVTTEASATTLCDSYDTKILGHRHSVRIFYVANSAANIERHHGQSQSSRHHPPKWTNDSLL